jgi:hypothetical protein
VKADGTRDVSLPQPHIIFAPELVQWTGIDFVTPQQAHDGQRKAIVEDRRAKAFSQRRLRREENQQKSGVQKTKNQRTSISQHSVV